MLITWDEKKAQSNLVKHGISFEEAQSVFFASASVTIADNEHGEDRFVTIAFSRKLNLLVVVYANRLEEESASSRPAKPPRKRPKFMKKEYDFSKGKVRKEPIADAKTAKVQTSIRLEYQIMEWAQREAEKLGIGYQTFLNMKLKETMERPSIEARVEVLEKKLQKRA